MRSPTYQHKIVFNKDMRVEISEKGYSVILDEFDEVPTESFDVNLVHDDEGPVVLRR